MKTKDLVYIAMYVALAVVLDVFKEMIPFINMPNGGSLNIPLIPVVIASFHLGWKKGLFVSFLWWLITFMLGYNNWFLNPVQYLLDYLVPYMALSFASIFYKNHSLFRMELGVILMMLVNILSIVISGVYFWAEGIAAGSMAAWIFSLQYNLTYSLPTLIMLVVLTPISIKLLRIDDVKMKNF